MHRCPPTRSWTRCPSIRIGGLIYPGYNLVVVGIGVVAAVALWAVIYRTKFGVMLRATSQDRRMASALGLNVELVYVSAFAIGCFMAGLGGAIVVPTQTAVLGMGIEALILAFVVVVIGGLGSLQGALVGALIVSFVRTAGIQFFPEIELAVLYLIAAMVLLVKPTGLFGSAHMKADVSQDLVSSQAVAGCSRGRSCWSCWRCCLPISDSIRRSS